MMKKMKKTLAACVATLMILLVVALPVFAETILDNVTDAAFLVTDEQWQTLEAQAEEISVQYQCGVYIITIDDFTNYVNTYDVEVAAKAFYEEYDLGVGPDKSGILLLMSTAARDYSLVAFGYGNTAFTDYGKDKLSEEFLDNFAKDDWNGGFTDYLTKCASMLQSARDGKPLDVRTDPLISGVGILVCLLLGCGIAAIICFFLRQSMRSVATGAEADAYIPAESIVYTYRNDRFSHTTEVRTKVEKKSSSGTTVDSGGFSSKSGKF